MNEEQRKKVMETATWEELTQKELTNDVEFGYYYEALVLRSIRGLKQAAILEVLNTIYKKVQHQQDKNEFAKNVFLFYVQNPNGYKLSDTHRQIISEWAETESEQNNIISTIKKENKMNIKELLSTNANVQVVLNVADLKEFAMELIEEAKNIEEVKPEPMFTPKEFAERHGVDKSTLWRWCKCGVLTPLHIGGKTFYRDSCLRIDECRKK